MSTSRKSFKIFTKVWISIWRIFDYRTNGNFLGEKLQSVAKELQRAADLLMEKEDDTIRIFDEVNGRIEVNYDKVADKKIRSLSTTDSLYDSNYHQTNGTNGHVRGSSDSNSSSNGSSDVDF